MLDLRMVFWTRFVKKYIGTPVLMFSLMWVGIILIMLALSGFARWYSLYSSGAPSTTKVGNEAGSRKPVIRQHTLTVTPVSTPHEADNVVPSGTNRTSKENITKPPIPIGTAITIATPTAPPTVSPKP